MSIVAYFIVACATLITRIFAESVCSDDFVGVLEGVPHLIPEHFLLPRPNDWTVLIPPVCQGEFLAGLEARVCTFVPQPNIRIVSWRSALVRLNSDQPIYTSVNVTVYCTPQNVATEPALPPPPPTTTPPPPPPPPPPPTTTTTSTTTTTTSTTTTTTPKPPETTGPPTEVYEYSSQESVEATSPPPIDHRLRTFPVRKDLTRRLFKSSNFFREHLPF